MTTANSHDVGSSNEHNARKASILPTAPASWLLLPVGRALLVAALITSAYVLVRYWRSLADQPRRNRTTLVGLRGLTLIFVSCALAGLSFEYDTTTRPRVLLVSTSPGDSTIEAANFTNDSATKELLTAKLRRNNFEVVGKGDVDGAEGGFVAAALISEGAISPQDANRQMEQTSSRVGGAPVYVIEDDSEQDTASVSLESATVLGHVLRGVPVAVRCLVHARGMRGRESLVTVSDDAKVQASARIAWTTDGERQTVTLTIVPKASGWIDYVAKVEAAGNEDVARRTRAFALFVQDTRLRVLFFEGEPSWESKFIRRALEQSGLFDVDYFAQVSRAATVGTTQDPEGGGSNPGNSERNTAAPDRKLHAILRNPASLNSYDSVVVGASPNAMLTAAESARLAAWVERRGGGLIVLGGNAFNGSVAARGGRLSSLMPAEVNSQSSAFQPQQVSQGRPLEAENTRGNVFLTPTEEGAGALSGYLSASEEIRSAALTGQGFKLGGLKPGATILAVAGQPNAGGTSEQGQPLIAAMSYGAGRTLVFAPADSWRMRTNASGEEDRTDGQFNSLWQGLVMWTSARSRPQAEIVLSDDSASEGSEVTAEIRVRDASYSPIDIEKMNLRIQPLTETSDETSKEAFEIAVSPDARSRSVWSAHFRMNERGRYFLQADVFGAGRSVQLEKQFAVVARSPVEPGTSFDTLRRVSRSTGGEFITPGELDQFVNRLSAAKSTSAPTHTVWDLRSWWPLAIIIPLLLSAEWFLRRWWRID